tara:strand:- start:370 stop:621 length:252 start_codon:yes stop_codon:yes gene_type:complete
MVIRQVSVLVYTHHDTLCANYGVDPKTQDKEELNFVADALVAGFDSLSESDEDKMPVTVANFSKLANLVSKEEFEREHGRVRD